MQKASLIELFQIRAQLTILHAYFKDGGKGFTPKYRPEEHLQECIRNIDSIDARETHNEPV
jgi:hypothetical protein